VNLLVNGGCEASGGATCAAHTTCTDSTYWQLPSSSTCGAYCSGGTTITTVGTFSGWTNSEVGALNCGFACVYMNISVAPAYGGAVIGAPYEGSSFFSEITSGCTSCNPFLQQDVHFSSSLYPAINAGLVTSYAFGAAAVANNSHILTWLYFLNAANGVVLTGSFIFNLPAVSGPVPSSITWLTGSQTAVVPATTTYIRYQTESNTCGNTASQFIQLDGLGLYLYSSACAGFPAFPTGQTNSSNCNSTYTVRGGVCVLQCLSSYVSGGGNFTAVCNSSWTAASQVLNNWIIGTGTCNPTSSESHSKSHQSKSHHSDSHSHSKSHRSDSHSKSHKSESHSHSKSHRSDSHSKSHKSESHSHSKSHRSDSHSKSHKSESHSHSKSHRSDSHSKSHKSESHSHSKSHRSDSHSKSHKSDSRSLSKSHRSDSHSKSHKSDSRSLSKSHRSDSHSKSHKSDSRSLSKSHRSDSHSKSHKSDSHSHSKSHRSDSHSKSHLSDSRSHSKSHLSDSHSHSHHSRSHSKSHRSDSHSKSYRSDSRSLSKSHLSDSHSKSHRSDSHSHSKSHRSDSHSKSHLSDSRSHSKSHQSDSYSASHESDSRSYSKSHESDSRSKSHESDSRSNSKSHLSESRSTSHESRSHLSESHSKSRMSDSRSTSHLSESRSISHASVSLSASHESQSISTSHLSNSRSTSHNSESTSHSVSLANQSACTTLYSYNRGSYMDTFTSASCPVYFRLVPSPAEFQPFLGFSIRVPPLVTAINFTYYGIDVSNLTVAYSSICDHIVTAYVYPPVITAIANCPSLNTTSAGSVHVTILSPPPITSSPVTNINVLFLNVPSTAIVYIGEISYVIGDENRVLIAECLSISEFPLARCTR